MVVGEGALEVRKAIVCCEYARRDVSLIIWDGIVNVIMRLRWSMLDHSGIGIGNVDGEYSEHAKGKPTYQNLLETKVERAPRL